MATRYIQGNNEIQGATDGVAPISGYIGERKESLGTAGVTKTGSNNANIIFDSIGAPTVTLGIGTWLLFGHTSLTCTDTSDGVSLRFYDNTGAAAFGAGSIGQVPTANTVVGVSSSGVISVTSGNKVIYLYGLRNGASTPKIGYGSAGIPYCGYILAIRIA